MAAKTLQKPTILEVTGNVIRIKHPDIQGYSKTQVIAPFTAADTTLSVSDNNVFENGETLLIGEVGDNKTEAVAIDASVTRGTSITVANTTKFDHELNAPVTRLQELKYKIYGAATDGGAGTLLESIDALAGDAVDIQWDKSTNQWALDSGDTTYAYYYATFYDGTTESSASDYVLNTGLAFNSLYKLAESGLNHVGAKVDGDRITWAWLLDLGNDFQKVITSYVDRNGISKDWAFEITEDNTSIATTENAYKYNLSDLTSDLKYDGYAQGVITMKMGSKELEPLGLDAIEDAYNGVPETTVGTTANSGDTSIVLTDVSEFSDSGSFYVGADLVTYTGRTVSTNTLTGIPASGSGSITATHTAGDNVFQGKSPGLPTGFTIFNGQIILNVPVSATYAGQKLKLRYIKALNRLDSLSDTTPIKFTYLAKYFFGSHIEARRKRSARAKQLMDEFDVNLEKESKKDRTNITEQTEYYNFPLMGI